MNRIKLSAVITMVLGLAWLLVACGGGQTLVTEEPADTQLAAETPGANLDVTETADNANVEEPVATETIDPAENVDPHEAVQEEREYSFTLDVLDETNAWGGSAEGYEIYYFPYDGDYPWWTGYQFPYEDYPEYDPPEPYEPDLLAVEIWAKGADSQKAFCFDLTFEDEYLRLEYAQMPNLTNPAIPECFVSMPSMTYTADNCYRHLQYMLNPDECEGRSGDVLLCTLMFEYGNSGSHWEPELVPPTGSENVAASEFDGATGTLSWDYCNCGDFNQDGLVDWFDGGVIAKYFGTEPVDPDSIPALVAGTGEIVTIQAISTIGQHMAASVDGYNIYTGAAADYPDNGKLLDNVAFSAAQGDPAAARLHFTYTVVEPVEGASYWVKPVDDGAEGVASEITPD